MPLNLIVTNLEVIKDLINNNDIPRAQHRLNNLIIAVQQLQKDAPDATELSYLKHHIRNNICNLRLQNGHIESSCRAMEQALTNCGKIINWFESNCDGDNL